VCSDHEDLDDEYHILNYDDIDFTEIGQDVLADLEVSE
jgi:hypothetical protein